MPMYKRPLLVLLFIAAVASGVLLWDLSAEDAPQETTLSSSSFEVTSAALPPEDDKQPSVLTVYVSGEVNAPGLVEISSGSRVGDAVEACGGFTPLADRAGVNLAQKAEDGMQINVAARREQTADGTPAAPAANSAQGGFVNLNTATKEELDTLPGIGPAMASRIIEYRQANGSFKSIEDIKEVKGIGEAKFAKMKDRLRI